MKYTDGEGTIVLHWLKIHLPLRQHTLTVEWKKFVSCQYYIAWQIFFLHTQWCATPRVVFIFRPAGHTNRWHFVHIYSLSRLSILMWTSQLTHPIRAPQALGTIVWPPNSFLSTYQPFTASFTGLLESNSTRCGLCGHTSKYGWVQCNKPPTAPYSIILLTCQLHLFTCSNKTIICTAHSCEPTNFRPGFFSLQQKVDVLNVGRTAWDDLQVSVYTATRNGARKCMLARKGLAHIDSYFRPNSHWSHE